MQQYKHISINPGLVPCHCIKQFLMPISFTLRALYLTYEKSSCINTSCIKKTVLEDKKLYQNTLIIWLRQNPLDTFNMQFLLDLQDSLSLRKTINAKIRYNLANIYDTYDYIELLITECNAFVSKGFMSMNINDYKSHILSFYKNMYNQINIDDFFVRKVNPIIQYNNLYGNSLRKCIVEQDIKNNIVVIPYINEKLNSFIETKFVTTFIYIDIIVLINSILK